MICLLLFEESNFAVRLVNGSDYSIGRLEVFYQGVWGTVCDDDFSYADAHVVCQELGFSGTNTYWGNARYGMGYGPIWLDDVACVGNESSIANCSHNPVGIHNCNHREDVSVSCRDGKAYIMIKFDLRNGMTS